MEAPLALELIADNFANTSGNPLDLSIDDGETFVYSQRLYLTRPALNGLADMGNLLKLVDAPSSSTLERFCRLFRVLFCPVPLPTSKPTSLRKYVCLNSSHQ